MRFEFATATRIVFGPGTVCEVSAAAAEMGRRALLVTRACAYLQLMRVVGEPFPVHGEPTVDMVRKGVRARDAACDVVIAMGGGSAIDAGAGSMQANPVTLTRGQLEELLANAV